MKFAWIDTQCRHYPLSALCEVLAVSVNGYRAWKRGGTPERQRLTDAQLLTLHSDRNNVSTRFPTARPVTAVVGCRKVCCREV